MFKEKLIRTLSTALVSEGLTHFVRKANIKGRAEAGRRGETAGGNSVKDCARSNHCVSDDRLTFEITNIGRTACTAGTVRSCST